MTLYTLSNLVDHSVSINEPLKHTQRIKYTSFDASTKYLIFGASSGSLYLFSRKPLCKFLHLIPTNHGPVINISISPDEKFISFATQKGIICVYVINLSAHSPPQVLMSNQGNDTLVTCLKWCTGGDKQFYYGDNKGQVNLVTLSFFMGRSLINLTVHPILFLDSPIVQISDFETLLVVSNHNKCILCNTEFEEYKQIGNKPRDGEYGACFLISSNEQLNPSRIFCARPGSRFWEVDLEGNVIQTHQFKQALACPPIKLPINAHKLSIPIGQNGIKNSSSGGNSSSTSGSINNKNIVNLINTNNQFNNIDEINQQKIIENHYQQPGHDEYKPQNLQYSKLQIIHNEFILTYTKNAIYIFDMRQSQIILWSNDFNDEILDCLVVGNYEIIIYEKCGTIFTINLQTLQSLVIELVQQLKFFESTLLLKKNLKYFAEKAKEDCNLIILNKIKNYLIDTNEYEMLNDLSVIFDSLLNQAENESSSGSGNTTDLKSIESIDSNNSSRCNVSNINNISMKRNQSQKIKSSSSTAVEDNNGVYILENSFCDNLKLNSTTERSSNSNGDHNNLQHNNRRLIKDGLLTVTGKFGKNIIKYKFNIFNDDTKILVNDLIPSSTENHQKININHQQQQTLREIQLQNLQFDDNDDTEIVCKKSSSRNSNKSSSILSTSSAAAIIKSNNENMKNKLSLTSGTIITDEEKIIYNLFLIYKSSKISNLNFIDRYRSIFDLYKSNEIIKILQQLELVMYENGDSKLDSKKSCYEMYFNYLKPELIYEFDQLTIDFIIIGFCLINETQKLIDNNIEHEQLIIRCNKCGFPIRFDNSICRYHDLGEQLLKYLWSRNEQKRCYDILNKVPAIFDTICRFYINDMNLDKVLLIALNYGSPELFQESAKIFDLNQWNKCFELFIKIKNDNQFICINCNDIINLNDTINNRHYFYTWNCFLNLALDHLNGQDCLDLVLKYSNSIPNDAIERDFFLKCVIKEIDNE